MPESYNSRCTMLQSGNLLVFMVGKGWVFYQDPVKFDIEVDNVHSIAKTVGIVEWEKLRER